MLLTLLNVGADSADVFPGWHVAGAAHNKAQIRNFHPTFDFDSNYFYPATPFHRNESSYQNPGLGATSSYYWGCRLSQF